MTKEPEIEKIEEPQKHYSEIELNLVAIGIRPDKMSQEEFKMLRAICKKIDKHRMKGQFTEVKRTSPKWIQRKK